MLVDLGVRHLAAVRLQRCECPRLVEAHKAAVTDDVGGQYCGQAAFHDWWGY
ncbi:hypothetical protein N182_22685 [Sinorhizobium sp. GL2]|nr:hypothetical protein N182_22685 [Sinorhizobium sp. GL2]